MYYSQFGEDRVLADIFQGKSHGHCVEVGANDGYNGSTTLHFERLGWDCVLVEPNPDLCAKLRAERSGQVFECAVSNMDGTAILQLAEGANGAHALSTISQEAAARRALRRHGYDTRPVEVSTRRLDAILEEAGFSGIDFISIDVEGHELSVLEGFSLDRWRPTVIIVEDNSLWGEHRVKSHLRERGYIRFHRSGVNDWFTHESNTDLAGRSATASYYRALFTGRALALRHSLAQRLKRVPGVERLYHAAKRIGK